MWTPRHSAEPLHAVAGQALAACVVTTVFGFAMLLLSCRNVNTRLLWLLLAGLNAIALWNYILANSAAYG